MDDSPNTPLALALVGGAALCFFLAARPWPQSGGKAVRPEAYAQTIISGQPMPPGPAPKDDTQGIELGLSAILSVWALSKIAGLFTGFPSLFGNPAPGEGATGGEEGGDEGGDGGGGIIGDIEHDIGEGAKDIEGVAPDLGA